MNLLFFLYLHLKMSYQIGKELSKLYLKFFILHQETPSEMFEKKKSEVEPFLSFLLKYLKIFYCIYHNLECILSKREAFLFSGANLRFIFLIHPKLNALLQEFL